MNSRQVYTAAEIHKMRNAINAYGFLGERGYLPHERAMEAESRLVTYLSQGVSPEDLINTLTKEADDYYKGRWG